MDIIVTKSAGFCFGVKRAVALAYRASKGKKGKVYTLGPLIHNPQVVKRLEEAGVTAKNSLKDIDGGVCILRSHGVTSKEAKEAKRRGFEVVDATCPFVTKSQELIRMLCSEGYYVLIVGDEKHPEVKALLSYSDPVHVRVVKSPQELGSLRKVKKVALLAQTTQPMSLFQEVLREAVSKAKELRVFNTICNATTLRQEESVALAPQVDCLFVVGGKTSSNTVKLAEACRAVNKRTFHIEEPGEIDPSWLRGSQKIGVTAGASTPRWLVMEVADRVRELGDGYC